jgi:hypothetical protein
MHDALRRRILRKLDTLPEAQLYQVLDYIEFMESKYNRGVPEEATTLQRLAERLEDGLRKGRVSPTNLREAFQIIASADRVLSSVSSAGKQLLQELQEPTEGRFPRDEGPRSPGNPGDPGARGGGGSGAGPAAPPPPPSSPPDPG